MLQKNNLILLITMKAKSPFLKKEVSLYFLFAIAQGVAKFFAIN